MVAANESAAISAANSIVAKWSEWTGLPEDSQLFEYVRNSKVDRNEVLQSAGETAEALKRGERTLQATYDLAMNRHGSIGPSCAVADFKNGRPGVPSAIANAAYDATGARLRSVPFRPATVLAALAATARN